MLQGHMVVALQRFLSDATLIANLSVIFFNIRQKCSLINRAINVITAVVTTTWQLLFKLVIGIIHTNEVVAYYFHFIQNLLFVVN